MNSHILNLLIAAISAVESSGNPDAIGDHGQAVGLLQIRMCVVQDVNRHYVMRFTAMDRFSPEKSKAIFRLYCQMYGCKTAEDRARTWNGGPTGPLKRRTAAYWKKVQKYMRTLSGGEYIDA
jgi:hypothetical protein